MEWRSPPCLLLSLSSFLHWEEERRAQRWASLFLSAEVELSSVLVLLEVEPLTWVQLLSLLTGELTPL